MKVIFGLCEGHITRRRNAILVSLVLFLFGAMVGIFFYMGKANIDGVIGLTLVSSSLALILASIVCGFIGARLVSVQRIDGDYIWLNYVNEHFLDRLPELPTN